jgi:CHASE3 domain sensor protein
MSAQRDWERQVAGSLQKLALINELERLVIDLETGVRGFVITREERFLEPWQQARVAFPDQAEELIGLTDDPVRDPLARQISADVESHIEDYASPLVHAARRAILAATVGRVGSLVLITLCAMRTPRCRMSISRQTTRPSGCRFATTESVARIRPEDRDWSVSETASRR